MPLTLYIDTEAWRAHQTAVLEANPGLIPVMKGNGYGFGNTRLAEEAAKLGVDRIAVGTVDEVAEVSPAFSGDVLVLSPYRPGDEPEGLPDSVIRTVSSIDGLKALAGRRVVIECLTSLRRHGVTEQDLIKLRPLLNDGRLEGFAVHLPLDRPAGVSPADEVATWLHRLHAAGMPPRVMYVSHLTPLEIADLAARFPHVTFRPRVGTRLWLGDRKAFQARATVLDVQRVARGERYGYRQRRALTDGYLVVVAGGTTHGVGLEAPKSVRGLVPRAKGVAIAGLATVNLALSPFRWAGRQRWFAEPPHMQVSVLFLPADVPPPAIGDELDVDVRMTITRFDRVVDR
ncbi:alanine racemase [Carbonactinospora thermoautotrophica]|uniref:alanine racemase n=1 Tax=Carbonactinospora thermoautotrophica TaxID=1469144 RepID=UPI003DA91E13